MEVRVTDTDYDLISHHHYHVKLQASFQVSKAMSDLMWHVIIKLMISNGCTQVIQIGNIRSEWLY